MDEIREAVEETASGQALAATARTSVPFFRWVTVHRGCNGSTVCIPTDGPERAKTGHQA